MHTFIHTYVSANVHTYMHVYMQTSSANPHMYLLTSLPAYVYTCLLELIGLLFCWWSSSTFIVLTLLHGVGSFADLQKPQVELDGKPCAAVGQSGLMALYDSLLTQVQSCSFCI